MDTGAPALTLSQTRLLATVIKTTRNMLVLAYQQNWDAVADLEVLRREDLKRCFDLPVKEDKEGLIAEALAVLLHLNEELASHLLTARARSLEGSRDREKSRSALEQYHTIETLR